MKVGDSVLELNRFEVFKITNQGWNEVRHKLSDPVQAVFMRTKKHCQCSLSDAQERKWMSDLRSNIAQIQGKLEQKLIESKILLRSWKESSA